MKLIIFDVGNAACSVISTPSKYGLMIDCGSHSDKSNPIDLLKSQGIKNWLELKPYITKDNRQFQLGLLHITHPDDDHVRNSDRIKKEFPPYLLQRRRYEEFPDSDKINNAYVANLDKEYRGKDPEIIDWGINPDKIKTFSIPLSVVKSDELLNLKIRNNSSILRYIEYNEIKILFAGDLEKDGWSWLAENDADFIKTMKNGLDILIAPHHGHKSGFPSALFDLTGNIKVVIHSKGSEGNIEGTDVSSQYSNKSDGVIYTSLNDNLQYKGKVLTTRSNGNIYMEFGKESFTIWVDKASSNHEKS